MDPKEFKELKKFKAGNVNRFLHKVLYHYPQLKVKDAFILMEGYKERKDSGLWCTDESHIKGLYYVPDGKSKECRKHHYRCLVCDKIIQIG